MASQRQTSEKRMLTHAQWEWQLKPGWCVRAGSSARSARSKRWSVSTGLISVKGGLLCILLWVARLMCGVLVSADTTSSYRDTDQDIIAHHNQTLCRSDNLWDSVGTCLECQLRPEDWWPESLCQLVSASHQWASIRPSDNIKQQTSYTISQWHWATRISKHPSDIRGYSLVTASRKLAIQWLCDCVSSDGELRRRGPLPVCQGPPALW